MNPREWRIIRRILSIGVRAILLVGLAALTAIPFVWMAVSSLHHQTASPPTLAGLFSPEKWRFAGWRGHPTESSSRLTLNLDRDRIIEAVFIRDTPGEPVPALESTAAEPLVAASGALPRVALTLNVVGRGRVLADPPPAGDGTYPRGTTVTLTAVESRGWHPENYATVLTIPELPVWRFAINSFILSSGVVILQLLLCAPAAFAFARLEFRGRDALFWLFLLTMMIPAPVLIVPLFTIVQKLGWLNTYLGMIVPYPYLSTAFGTFLLRQYFITIPRSLDEAARLDGCGNIGLLWHILLPSAKPAVVSVTVFAFLWSWGDFYWPSLATTSMTMRPLEVGLSVFRDSYADRNWPMQMTASVLVILPMLIVFIAAQRFFVRGLATSGLKA